ncbi:MAG: carbohydrate ABC transporter permease [Anaerolineales bacterium]
MSIFTDAIPKRYREGLTGLLTKPLEWLLSVLDLLLLPIQRLIGVNRMAYVFLLPNLLIFGIFILLPMLMNFYIGFTGGNSFAIENREWVGTENLDRIFSCENYTDPNTCEEDLFWRGARNTFSYVIIQVSTMVIWALLTALALNGKIRFRGFFRSVFFYPVLLSPVVAALIWRWFLSVDAGVFNALLEDFGFDRISFFTDANWSRFWVIVVSDWMFMGFYTLILLAGLQSIPGELYEAADMDGANAFQRFFGITLPLLMPTMTVVLVLALIRAVQIFDQVFVLTGGGPGTATTYMVQFIYREAFGEGNRNLGLAASASLLLASTLMVLTLTQLYFARRNEAT